MTNQEIQEKIVRLKIVKENEEFRRDYKQKEIQEHQDKIDALENEILGLENYLKEEVK